MKNFSEQSGSEQALSVAENKEGMLGKLFSLPGAKEIALLAALGGASASMSENAADARFNELMAMSEQELATKMEMVVRKQVSETEINAKVDALLKEYGTVGFALEEAEKEVGRQEAILETISTLHVPNIEGLSGEEAKEKMLAAVVKDMALAMGARAELSKMPKTSAQI